MNTSFSIGEKQFSLNFPENSDSLKIDILKMAGAEKLSHPPEAITAALANPIGTVAYDTLIRNKLQDNPESRAVIVISDNTRPVPYKGEQGILKPLVLGLIDNGVPADRITILCANGTHVPLADSVFREMLDPDIFTLGVQVVNHDCLDEGNLKELGYTSKGTKIKINKTYCDADIKILTGLVESHFMAGVSGGRKSICPGLVGEDSTFIFHGVDNLAHDKADDLVLSGNPCHDEAIEVASSIGADFILNVTLNQDFDVTGCFAGDMVKAHLAAYDKVKSSVGIAAARTYDIVVSHAGFVGKNHYQAAKTGVAAIPLLHSGSYFILAGDCTDQDPVGKKTYRKVLELLKNMHADTFIELLRSDDWEFVPDQWQVQMWAKLFAKIPQNHFIYYAPQINKIDYSILPGIDGNRWLPDNQRWDGNSDHIPQFLESALASVIDSLRKEGKEEIRIAWMDDGPYGIVLK